MMSLSMPHSFEIIKQAFRSSSVLSHPNEEVPFMDQKSKKLIKISISFYYPKIF